MQRSLAISSGATRCSGSPSRISSTSTSISTGPGCSVIRIGDAARRWIGVEVPWKAHYHEKFHIKLTTESPLVLVLSQLDDPLLQGPGRPVLLPPALPACTSKAAPRPRTTVVRSHGNHLMERSVSIELPSMLPGACSVWINVVGTRRTSYPSIEEVVGSRRKISTVRTRISWCWRKMARAPRPLRPWPWMIGVAGGPHLPCRAPQARQPQFQSQAPERVGFDGGFRPRVVCQHCDQARLGTQDIH